jgi:FimV-like protein
VATQRTTVEQDNLWDIAGQLAPALGATRQQVMVAVLRRNPDAFVKGNIHRLRRGVPLVLPERAEVLAEDRALSVALVADHLKAMRGSAVLAPLPLVSAAAVVPAPVAPASAPTPPAAPSTPSVAPPAPVPASAVVVPVPPASAPASAAEPAASAIPPDTRPSDAPADAAGAASAAVGGGTVPGVLPWLLALGAVAGGVILWRRRRAGFQPDTPAQPDFSSTLSATRSGGPRVFDISNAAAEVARSVETSQAATQLVHSQSAPADEMDVAQIVEQAAIKLDIARASLEVGRPEAARALLQAVVREGSGRHAAEAAEILARLG